jgi:internalin A
MAEHDKTQEQLAERRIQEALASHATELELTGMGLTALPELIGQLKTLQKLRLTNNRLTALPESIGQLSQLKSLRVWGNQLRALPESIGQLERLELLDVSRNALTVLPESTGKLSQLTGLYAWDDKLRALPESIGELGQLKRLTLSENELHALPESMQKLKLQELYLHGNHKLGIPLEVLGLGWGDVQSGKGTPVRPGDILTYYFKKQRAAQPLNEVKLLLVGRGTAGKSSIRDRLLFNTFDPHKRETPGIQIDRWSLQCGQQAVLVRVWDFAGQQITHATHQFFLTERSVYLLVLDGRANTQDRDAEYWLRLISAFGKDSPVIIALNKSLENPFDVDRFALQEKYPSLRSFVVTDCLAPIGIDDLKKEIAAAIEGLDAVHQPFPAVWTRLKDGFSGMKDNYLPLDAFRNRCAEQGENNPNDQERLARILHALGIILYYGDDPRLRDTTVLNPHWVTESIYKLLRLKARPGAEGILTFDEARAALPQEKPEMVTYLIDLMRRFELCFPVGKDDEDEKRWFVPELLPQYQPLLNKEEWLDAQAKRLRYVYKVLPEGLIPRLVTRTYPLSADQVRWRGGVVLSMGGARALIRANSADAQVDVTVIGDEDGSKRLVKLIRNHFQHIHRDVQGLDPEEVVEVEGHRGVYKSVKVLEVDEQEGNETTVDSNNRSVKIDHTHELNRISSPAARNPQQPRLKLFLSYSHKDARLRDVFRENLALLEADGLITPWFDGQILPSSEWDKEIRREVEEADIMVLMVSTAFLKSSYIRGVELARAMQRRALGQAELVPIILEADCDWQSRGFSRYQALPPGVKAVRSWARHADAFNRVEQELRRLIKEKLASQALARNG